MAELTKPRSSFPAGPMRFMGPGDGGFFPGSASTAIGATGSPMKRAKVMRTTGTDIVTTANYPEYGGQATDPRHFHHGETTGFTPITATLSNIDVGGGGRKHNERIPAGSVLCGSKLKIQEQVRGAWNQLTSGELPLPIVNDAECRNARMGKVTANLTVAVEGRALINRRYLASDCCTWQPGDKLYWKMPHGNIPWTLAKVKSKRPDALYHAILYNEIVGGNVSPLEHPGSTSSAGYVLVFIVGMP